MKANLLIAFILCTTLVTCNVACSSSKKAPNGMTGAEILDVSNSSVVDTMQYNAAVEMILIGDTTEINFMGAVNELNKEAYYSRTAANSTDIILQMYAINGQLYRTNQSDETSWIKTELVDDIWKDINKAGQYITLLESFNKAEYDGMEVVNGGKCYKINIEPDSEALLNVLGLTSTKNVSTEEMVNLIRNPWCVAWIAENTYYPLQIFFNLTLDLQYWGNMTVESTMSLSDFNQPIHITLPTIAENATVISYDEFMRSSY